MVLFGRSSSSVENRRDPASGLEDSMRRLALGRSNKDEYPERPGEQDCSYFMRTGSCSYGGRCRYNHPRDRGNLITFYVAQNPVQLGAPLYPERVGQPVCEFFMKTGRCKFGPACHYHHPKGAGSLLLNLRGYPLRQGEKDCTYYLKTGSCKFGFACRYNHPEPSVVHQPAPSILPIVQATSVPSPQQPATLSNWQVCGPSLIPQPHVPGSFGPVFISSSSTPVPGWSTYSPSVNPAMDPGGQQMIQTRLSYEPMYQYSLPPLAYVGPCSQTGPSTINEKEHKSPERSGQAICQHYLKTGACKFGKMCKFHHPSAWCTPQRNCILSPLGLPLRPGAQTCPVYAQFKVCSFGPTCYYDHPVGKLGCSPSASSLSDIPVASYPAGLSLPTLAPSASLRELQN